MVAYLLKIIRLLRKIIASDTLFLAASRYLAVAIGFVNNLVVARFLGPTEYGTVALVIAYPTLIWTFVSFKPVTITTRYITNFRANQKGKELLGICKLSYGLDLLSAITTITFVGVTSWWVASHIYQLPELSGLTICYSLSFLFLALIGTSKAILTSWLQFRGLAVFGIFSKGFNLFVVVLCLWKGLGVPGVILGTVAGDMITGLAMASVATLLLYRHGMGFWWNGSCNQLTLIRNEMASFFSWNYVFVTLTGLIGQIPLMLLGRFRDVEEVGFYRLATSLVTASTYLGNSLGQVVYPQLCNSFARGNWLEVRPTLKRCTLSSGLPLSLLLLLVIIILPRLLPLVFGSHYMAMITGTQLMMAGTAITTIFFWVNPCYYAWGKIKFWTQAYSIYTALSIGLAWFFIPEWGFFGWSWIYSLGQTIFTVIMVSCLEFSVRRSS